MDYDLIREIGQKKTGWKTTRSRFYKELCVGSHKAYHNSLLCMKSVLSLVEYLICMLLEYLCGDLFLAVCGQAVHYHCVGLCRSHYSVVDLVALEYLPALLGFALLTHGSPYVSNTSV